MANLYSDYLESSVQSPLKFKDMLEDLDSNSDVEVDTWYENRQLDDMESDPDLEFILNALERIGDSWWDIRDPEIIERNDSYHIELPVRYEVVRDGPHSGEVGEYILGTTIYTDEGVEQEIPDEPRTEKVEI